MKRESTKMTVRIILGADYRLMLYLQTSVQGVIKIIRGKDNWLGDFDIIEHVNL